ncbi:hypothetical protein [Vreelandella massiliensis]|uniref:hypothetical protein n=1 Tax=Vreelandella massiliensis TaxID=1816686 RepID=UPI00096A8D96|nr:hypothetical protein [Halomonas massiliensis]
MSQNAKVDQRESNAAIRTLLRGGLSNPHIQRALGVNPSRIDDNRKQMETEMGLPRPYQVGRIAPRSLMRCKQAHRQYSIAIAMYAQLRTPLSEQAVDVVALIRSYNLLLASVLDDDNKVKFCINKFFRAAEWYEQRQVTLGAPDEDGMAWLTEVEQPTGSTVTSIQQKAKRGKRGKRKKESRECFAT